MMSECTIRQLGSGKGIRFAAHELQDRLEKTSRIKPSVCKAQRYDSRLRGLWLGLFEDFPGVAPTPSSSHPFDDEIFIHTQGESGIIAGSNSRSALLAVYRYLTEQGFRWVRPGKDGELIPHLKTLRPVSVRERAGYRHRGVCIEGADSYEHVRDIVDWLPKVGMSAYFLQFRDGYTFFDRWYNHELNPLWKHRKKITREDASRLTRRICHEIKKRDLILHKVGHGWTCEPLGIPGLGWYQHEGPLPARARKLLAEVNGKRTLWGGIALNTNLCYGNPEAQKIITDAIVDHGQEFPEVDIIHFWLADGCNNQCECPLCRDERPADHYVRMLNLLDAKLTAKGLPTRIVFLVYVDLLWPPVRERISNPDRFILMFAPITRSYSASFAATSASIKLPPYQRNKLKFPNDPKLNIAFLLGWQKGFAGDGFDFDYHLIWDHYKDPGYTAIADVLQRDIRGLRTIGLNGFNSCQVQRCFFPTAFPMIAMARTLWNPDISLNVIADDYYKSAFGENGKKVRDYLEGLTDLFNPRLLRSELTGKAKQVAIRNLRHIPDYVAAFLPEIQQGETLPQRVHAQSWKYLRHHAEICCLLSHALERHFTGDKEGTRELGLQFIELIRRKERVLHRVLDGAMLLRVLSGFLGVTWEELQGNSG